MKMCEETRRSRTRRGFEVIFSYGEEFLSLNEMLERQEILNTYNGMGWNHPKMLFVKEFQKGYATVALPRISLWSMHETHSYS